MKTVKVNTAIVRLHPEIEMEIRSSNETIVTIESSFRYRGGDELLRFPLTTSTISPVLFFKLHGSDYPLITTYRPATGAVAKP